MSVRPLRFLGMVIRTARVNRGLSQDRAAKAAGVSRQQFARLEDGENVSVLFLQKILRSLEIAITIGEGTAIGNPSTALVDAFVQWADDLTAFAERARELAYEAALPPSEQDTTAIAAFVSTSASPGDAARLARALERLTNDVGSVGATRDAAKKSRRQQARRKRQG